MGYQTALELKVQLETGQAMVYHLRYNHYPPIPMEMVKVAVQTVELANMGEFDKVIETPFEHQQYGYQVPVHAIVKALHLDAFIEYQEEY